MAILAEFGMFNLVLIFVSDALFVVRRKKKRLILVSTTSCYWECWYFGNNNRYSILCSLQVQLKYYWQQNRVLIGVQKARNGGFVKECFLYNVIDIAKVLYLDIYEKHCQVWYYFVQSHGQLSYWFYYSAKYSNELCVIFIPIITPFAAQNMWKLEQRKQNFSCLSGEIEYKRLIGLSSRPLLVVWVASDIPNPCYLLNLTRRSLANYTKSCSTVDHNILNLFL